MFGAQWHGTDGRVLFAAFQEEQLKTVKIYYKEGAAGAGTVPYLPFLLVVVAALLGTTVLVVSSTGGLGA